MIGKLNFSYTEAYRSGDLLRSPEILCAAYGMHIMTTSISRFFQNRIRKRIEVVITALTRNQVASQEARGFESHRFRQKIPVHRNGNFFIQAARLGIFVLFTILRITVFAWDVPHIDNTFSCAGVVFFVLLFHLTNGGTPFVMKFPGICIDDIVVLFYGFFD